MDKVIIKTPEEIEKMRELGRLVAEALDYIGQFVKPGVTTNEIDKLVYDYHVNVQGGYPAPLNYGNPPYPKSCCTSVNHVICHGIPDDKPLKEGDIVNIDLTIKKDGFHGDSSRMFTVGKVSPIAQRLIDVTHASMMAGIEAVKPGATLGDVGYACQQVAENAGYSVVQEFCGRSGLLAALRGSRGRCRVRRIPARRNSRHFRQPVGRHSRRRRGWRRV